MNAPFSINQAYLFDNQYYQEVPDNKVHYEL
jgi:hypothetical protein